MLLGAGAALCALHDVLEHALGWKKPGPSLALDATEVEQLKEEYQRNGFVVVRQALPPAEVAVYDGALEAYKREVVPLHRGAQSAFYDTIGTSGAHPASLKFLNHVGLAEGTLDVEPHPAAAVLASFQRHPALVSLAEALLGEAVLLTGPYKKYGCAEYFNKAPGHSKQTPPHQDNFYFNLRPCSVLTMWMAFDPVDEGNGCLRYLKHDLATGRHANSTIGLQPHHASMIKGFSQRLVEFGDDDAARMTPVHLQPGDLVIHHGETIHRADANSSKDRQRRALGVVYQGVSATVDQKLLEGYKQSLAEQAAKIAAEGASAT